MILAAKYASTGQHRRRECLDRDVFLLRRYRRVVSDAPFTIVASVGRTKANDHHTRSTACSRCFVTTLFFPSALPGILIRRTSPLRTSPRNFAALGETHTAEDGTDTARPIAHSVPKTRQCSSGFCSVEGVHKIPSR